MGFRLPCLSALQGYAAATCVFSRTSDSSSFKSRSWGQPWELAANTTPHTSSHKIDMSYLISGKTLETVGAFLVAYVGVRAACLEIFIGRRLRNDAANNTDLEVLRQGLPGQFMITAKAIWLLRGNSRW